MRNRVETRRELLRWGVAGLTGGAASYLARDGIIGQASGQAGSVPAETARMKALSTSPELAWKAVFGESAGFPYAVTQTTDGGFVFFGRSLNRSAEVVVAKTSPGPDPSLDWTEPMAPDMANLGTYIYRNAFAITNTDNGVVCSAPANDLFLFKLDESGETVWQRSYPDLTTDAEFSYFYGGDAQIIGTGMVEASDGGYLLTGLGGVLLKTDASGRRSWVRALTPEINGQQAPLVLVNAVRTANGGYALSELGPRTDVSEGESGTYWPGIVTVDENGQTQWRHQYHQSLREALSFSDISSALPAAIDQTTDGGFVLTGVVAGPDGNQETFVVKTGSDGETEWTRTQAIPTGRGSFAPVGWTDVLSTDDGGIVLVGTTAELTTTLLKLDADSGEAWSKSLENTHGTKMTQTNDGGRVLTGLTAGENTTGAGLLKFGGSRTAPRFDPETHGFGFENWATGLEVADIDVPERFDADANKFPSHSHDKVTKEEIQSVVNSEWKDQLERRFDVDVDGLSEAALNQLATYIYTAVNEGSATGGHCWGMMFTAQHYFENPDAIPLDFETASEISKPTLPEDDSAEPVGTDIDRRQTNLYLNLDAQLAVSALDGSDPIDYDYQLERIRDSIARRGTAPICLRVKGGGKHQVLAYDVEEGSSDSDEQTAGGTETPGGTVSVWVYNPFHMASSYDTPAIRDVQRLVFDRSGNRTTLEKTPPVNNPLYDRAVFIGTEQETDLDGLYRAGTIQTTELLVRKLFKRAFFAVQSPVSLTVTGPDGKEIPPLVRPYEDREIDPNYNPAGTEYEQIHYVWEAPAGEYDLELTGEESGEYTLRAVGATVDGGHIDTRITNTIEQGEIQRFKATIPSERGDGGSLNRDDTGDADMTENSTPTDEGGGNSGLVVGGALSGLGVGGYLLYRRLRDTDGE